MKLIISIVQDEDASDVIEIIKKICKKRKELLVAPTTFNGSESGYMNQYPLKINVGGATLFVLDVDQFIKI